MFNLKNINKAFTLVELIVVIVILAILATIAFLSFSSQSGSARDSVRLSDTTNIRKGLELRQAVAGVLPMPASVSKVSTGGTTATGVTGVTITEGVINSSVLKELSSGIKDPSGTEYRYSTISQGGSQPLYYQLALELENPTSLKKNVINPFVTVASAAVIDTSKVAQLKGNYSFDPSLPSLFVLSGSTSSASGGIYNPNICFVLDKSTTNTFSNKDNCVPKSAMNLKDYDSSLVGYWDMESYYQTAYSGVNNVVFIKDLSGNGYDMNLYNSLIEPGNFITTSSGSIFGSGVMSKGIIFDKNNFNMSFSTLPFNKSFVYNGRKINTVPGNIFLDSNISTGSQLIPGISMTILFDYDRVNGSSGIKRMVTFNLGNEKNIIAGDYLKVIDASFVRIIGTDFQSHITPYNDYTAGSINAYSGLKGCGNNNSLIGWQDLCGDDDYYETTPNSVNGKSIMTTNINFNEKKFCLYLNGNKFVCNDISDATINRIIEKGNTSGAFAISGGFESFVGTIDEVKIYNRSFSSEEIKRQAKSAGF